MSSHEVTPSLATGSTIGRQPDPKARKRVGPHSDDGLAPQHPDEANGRNRRRHERLPAHGLSIEIDGWSYTLQDLSLGGFRVSPYHGTLTVDQEFAFMMRLAVDGDVTPFQARGRVIRVDGKGLVAVYVTSEPDFYRKLSQFIERERKTRLSYGAGRAGSAPEPAFLSKSI